MPTLTNAERQQRFRDRRKAQMANDPSEVARLKEEIAALRHALKVGCLGTTSAALTPEQEEDRRLLIADLKSNRSWGRLARVNEAKFMGMSRDSWVAAPAELIEHFGLTKIVDTGRRMQQLDLHEHHARGGRRYQLTKRHAEKFGR